MPIGLTKVQAQTVTKLLAKIGAKFNASDYVTTPPETVSLSAMEVTKINRALTVAEGEPIVVVKRDGRAVRVYSISGYKNSTKAGYKNLKAYWKALRARRHECKTA